MQFADTKDSGRKWNAQKDDKPYRTVSKG